MTQEEKKEQTTNTENTENTQEQTPTIEGMFEELKKARQQDKTDAVKMQKYHALTDAFNALGKMGGAAIGGAIGGNVLDSAPNVGEYQPSRGYVDAFERAKQANERLRAIDDMEFKLAVDKQQKDADRAYNDKVRLEDRNYRSAEAQLEREWQMKFYNYKTQIEQAIADKNWERSAELQQKMAADAQAHELKMQNLRNSGSLAEAQVRNETARLQVNKKTPVIFNDDTVLDISEDDIKAIKAAMIGKKINGVWITKDNVDTEFLNNPKLVQERLALIRNSANGGMSYTTASTEGTASRQSNVSFPQHMSQVPKENMTGRTENKSNGNNQASVIPEKKWESSEVK